MNLFDELFGLNDEKRSKVSHILHEFLEVFRDIRDTQKERLTVEKDIRDALNKIAEQPPVRGVVKLGKPQEQ